MHHRPSTGKRVRQKGFTRLVGDETAEGCDMRWEAYKQCWSNTDAHISRVLVRVGTFQFANQSHQHQTKRFQAMGPLD